jgi:hypothetical protein
VTSTVARPAGPTERQRRVTVAARTVSDRPRRPTMMVCVSVVWAWDAAGHRQAQVCRKSFYGSRESMRVMEVNAGRSLLSPALSSDRRVSAAVGVEIEQGTGHTPWHR